MLSWRKSAQSPTVTTETKKGSLEVVHGSMFGGKTEHLIACLRRAQAEGLRVAAFKHCIDDRYDPSHLVTHTQDHFDAIRVADAESILSHCDNVKVGFVAIDEGQFFKTPLIPVVQALLDRGVSVVVAGISNDAWGRPFEPMPQLVELADHVEVRQSPCRVCGKAAPYTQRMSSVDTLHMVGGLDDYEPRCKEHFEPLPGPAEPR